MKKFIATSFVLFLFLTAFSQQVINDENAEKRDVKGFHAIKVSRGIELKLTQSTEEAVAVSAAEKEDLQYLITKVENGVLKIYYDKNFVNNTWKKKLKAYVSFIMLDKLTAISGSKVITSSSLNFSTLKLDVSSGANVELNLTSTSLTADLSSGAQIVLSGKTNILKVDASSGSAFKGFELSAENCEAESSSGASVQVSVSKELDASANSGGQVRYKGENLKTNIEKSSGGSVKKA